MSMTTVVPHWKQAHLSTYTYWQGTYHTFSLNKRHITILIHDILMVYKQPTTLKNAGYQIIYAPLSINKNAHRGSVMPIIYTRKFLELLFWANISANKSNRFFFVTYCNIVLLIFMNRNCSIKVALAIYSDVLCTYLNNVDCTSHRRLNYYISGWLLKVWNENIKH